MDSALSCPRVLLVDDSSQDLNLLSEAFSSISFPVEVETCTTGHLAFATLQAVCLGAGGSLPDLVVIDVRMPGITGIDLLHAIKGIDGLKDIPVVMITTVATPRDREQCSQFGAVGLVEKPVDFPTDLDLARHLAGLLQSRS